MNKPNADNKERDKNEYVNRLQYIGKLKREWYMRGAKDERSALRKKIEGIMPLDEEINYEEDNYEAGKRDALSCILSLLDEEEI